MKIKSLENTYTMKPNKNVNVSDLWKMVQIRKMKMKRKSFYNEATAVYFMLVQQNFQCMQ